MQLFRVLRLLWMLRAFLGSTDDRHADFVFPQPVSRVHISYNSVCLSHDTMYRSICDNGGTWTQGHCFCPRTFYGSHCELAAREIYLDMVDSEVGMEVSVDQEFSADLKDNSSKVYRDFVNTFRDQIKKIYQNVQGFKEVQILSLRNGSIVVEYLVLLELPFSLQVEEEYEKVKVALKEELQNVSQDGNSCQNDQAICRRAAAEGFEDFYFPFLEENQLRCVTNCTAGVEGAIDCHQGQCVLQRSGPSCRCFSTDTHWFWGPRCEVAISWKALAGGLAGAGALLLLLLVVALSLFVVRSRRRDRQGRGRSRDDRKLFETWDESAKLAFSNFAFQQDRSVKDKNFSVALDTVDTNARVRGQGWINGSPPSLQQHQIQRRGGGKGVPCADAGPAPSLRGASGPMQLFRVLRLLWMLRAFLGSTGPCKNGGTWTQGRCSCPSAFHGPKCEFAEEELNMDKVDAEVGMEVSVNQEFSPDLNDNSSQVYKDFTKAFQDEIKKIYQNVQGFKEVQILSLRNGSIVVEYLVLLELPFSLQVEEEYEKVKVALKEELQNVSQDGNSCQNDQVLCFKPDSIKVNNNTRTELSPKAICRRAAAEGFEDFYFPILEENQLRCVTNCTAGVEGAIDCHQGQCVVQRSGPSCRCFSTDTHWFWGPRCEVAISWKALVGGLAGAGALLLLLLVVALSVFIMRSRRRDRQGRGRSGDDRKWFETWDANTEGTFSNSGFEDDTNEENFPVALNTVDTNVRTLQPGPHAQGDAGDLDPADGFLALGTHHCLIHGHYHICIIRGGGCSREGHPGHDLILSLGAKGVTLETHGTNGASPSSSSPSETSTHTTTTAKEESTSGFSSPVASTSPGSTGTPVPGYRTTSTLQPLFTRTQTTVRTTHSSTMTPLQCYNNATWNGKECVCAQGYFGYQCKDVREYFFIETPQKINATIDLRVKVTNRNFTDDLNDKSSDAYKNFVQVFKSQMDKVYRGNNFPQYRGVNVIRLLPGSIVVEHEVIMEANYTSGYLELFENLTKIVKAKIMNETTQLHGNSKDCKNLSLLCYDETATIVNPVKVGFDPQEQCTKNSPKEFSQFYYIEELDGKLACVTKCTPGTKSEMDCHHGTCQLQQSGPRCLCLNSDTHWYSGETCESSTSKSMVYGIVGAVGALLVVLVVVLIFLLGRSQRKLHRQEYDMSREWQDADYPGSFENTSVWEGEDLKGDTFGLENIYRNFQPSLGSVDPTTEGNSDV
ncbi:hypothetical protein MJT46_018005 [Ovis ammon polii x Ovis aries]|nr:hypothetical protein MJT46_018005 [Ovis ammon polii x Ovis aries]